MNRQGLKPNSSVFCFVVAVVETANGILRVVEIVVLDEPKSVLPVNVGTEEGDSCSLPFALPSRSIDDGLGALDVSKPTAVRMQHLIAGIWM